MHLRVFTDTHHSVHIKSNAIFRLGSHIVMIKMVIEDALLSIM